MVCGGCGCGVCWGSGWWVGDWLWRRRGLGWVSGWDEGMLVAGSGA